jgi:hypothetical protein
MDNYDFLNTFPTAVAASTAIGSWATTQFGKSVTVYIDLEGGALPTKDNMPYVIFHTPGVSKDQEVRDRRYQISADIAINKETFKTRAETTVKEPTGIELVLDFATLIAACVKSALPGNTLFGYNLSADTLGSLPEVFGYIDFTFVEHITLGSDPID